MHDTASGKMTGNARSSSGAAVSVAHASSVREALVRSLFGQAWSTICIALATQLVAAGLLRGHTPDPWLFTWLACGMCFASLRLILVERGRHSPTERLPVHAYTGVTVLTGTLWGALAFWWSPELPLVQQIVIILFPMALSVGAVMAYSARLSTFLAYMVPALIPMPIAFLMSDEVQTRVLAVPALLFAAGISMLGARFHRNQRRTIELQLRNVRLLDDVSRQNRDLALARNEAEIASHTKSDFLDRVSHEYRTPIAGILGPAEILAGTNLDDRQRHLLDSMVESGRLLLRLVDEVLDVADIDAGRKTLVVRPFSITELFDAALGEARNEARAKGLQLEWHVDPELRTGVTGDAEAVRRVLLDLVENAIDFTERGHIRIAASRMRATSGADLMQITVTDTGAGIAADKIDQIFEDFAQGEGSMTRRSSGTGLGLSIVKRLVELMGGSIGLTSEAGKGSSFRVLIPMQLAETDVGSVASVAPAEPMADTSADVPAGTLQALVVEDNPVNQMVIETMLEEIGCHVIVVDNGAEALDIVDKQMIDIIFMDCQMPVMNGFEATEAIRQRGLDTPIIAVTANVQTYDRRHCLESGMNDFMSKPFDAHALGAMLQRWIAPMARPSATAGADRPG